jgi:branched-chain amino acid transport system permease protein
VPADLPTNKAAALLVDAPAPVTAPPPAKVGRRRILPALRGHGGASWHRWRYPLTRRTPLLYETSYNPVTLAAERRIVNPGPLLWLAALAVLAIAPPLLGNNSFVGAATLFEMYAAINVVWMLQIGTAGIFSLASLATVGFAAYGTAVLSVYAGFPWWAMWLTGPLFGLVFGVLIAIPATRLEGFYYALLTVGIAELCRVYSAQSQFLGAANGGLFGAARFVPDSMSERHGLVLGYYAAFALLLGGLLLYRLVNGQRLGRLLRAAPERHEAFAEALGINYRAARIQVFLISSAALGGVGGFYATLLHGATPSLFTMDQLLLLLAMIVIGGIGTTEGAVVGTLIVVLLDKVFIGLGPSRLILIAGVMLGTVLFLRGGLFGLSAQYRAWRGKKLSERRAARSGRGGEVMPEQAIEIADKQTIYERRFDAIVRAELKRLVTDQLIEEHRTTMGKRRSDALERVLAYFRRAAVADKYAVLAVKPFAEYRIVALSGRRGVPPRIVDDQVFKTPDEALHGVFLKRVQDLMES